MTLISDPWPWYISGPMIALILFLLLMVGKNFGMSSNFEHFVPFVALARLLIFLGLTGNLNNGIWLWPWALLLVDL